MTNDPSAAKYQIKARIAADGVIDKPDVVGAVFGQTEGLLGDELDLRDLQKSGRIGRIEVEIDSRKGKSEGEIVIPSSLDQVETAILASGLETVHEHRLVHRPHPSGKAVVALPFGPHEDPSEPASPVGVPVVPEAEPVADPAGRAVGQLDRGEAPEVEVLLEGPLGGILREGREQRGGRLEGQMDRYPLELVVDLPKVLEKPSVDPRPMAHVLLLALLLLPDGRLDLL